MSSGTTTKNNAISQTDFLPLLGTDHIEFYVGNAKQAAHYYITAFGFSPLPMKDPKQAQRIKPVTLYDRIN
jgi:4-hydroxyphenylpyruvate dioxygenase